MRFHFAALALLFTTSSATDITKDFDIVFKPEEDQVVNAGSTVEIAWKINNTAKYEDVKVDIHLIGGHDPKTLRYNGTVASGLDNSDLKYKWHVDPSLGHDKQYGIQILLSSDRKTFAYSPRFTIQKTSTEDSTTTEDTSSTETTAESATESTTKTTSASKHTASSEGHESESWQTTATSTSVGSTSTTAGIATTTNNQSTSPSAGTAAGFRAPVGAAAAIVGCAALVAF